MCSRYPDDKTQEASYLITSNKCTSHVAFASKCSQRNHIIVVHLNIHSGCMMSQSISDKSVISTANVCLGSAGKKVTAGMRCVNDSNKSLNIHQCK